MDRKKIANMTNKTLKNELKKLKLCCVDIVILWNIDVRKKLIVDPKIIVVPLRVFPHEKDNEQLILLEFF